MNLTPALILLSCAMVLGMIVLQLAGHWERQAKKRTEQAMRDAAERAALSTPSTAARDAVKEEGHKKDKNSPDFES